MSNKHVRVYRAYGLATLGFSNTFNQGTTRFLMQITYGGLIQNNYHTRFTKDELLGISQVTKRHFAVFVKPLIDLNLMKLIGKEYVINPEFIFSGHILMQRQAAVFYVKGVIFDQKAYTSMTKAQKKAINMQYDTTNTLGDLARRDEIQAILDKQLLSLSNGEKKVIKPKKVYDNLPCPNIEGYDHDDTILDGTEDIEPDPLSPCDEDF